MASAGGGGKSAGVQHGARGSTEGDVDDAPWMEVAVRFSGRSMGVLLAPSPFNTSVWCGGTHGDGRRAGLPGQKGTRRTGQRVQRCGQTDARTILAQGG